MIIVLRGDVMAEFRRGYDFPNEGFVQNTIESYFKKQGCSILEEGYADLVCICNRSDKWIIEAKGETAAVGLDFRTGIGQLIQRMDEKGVIYGIAVPETPQFIMQSSLIPQWVRNALNIHLIFVNAEGKVRIICPSDSKG